MTVAPRENTNQDRAAPLTTPPRPTISPSIKSFAGVTSAATALIGILVLLGWQFQIFALQSLLSGLTTMKANTALGFVLGGAALWLLLREPPRRWREYAAQALAGAILLMALLTLGEYLFGWKPGIDEVLFKDLSAGNLTPGRMSPITALNFLLLAGAILFLAQPSAAGERMAQGFALALAFVSGAAWLGYVYGATELYGLGHYTQIAAHTTLTFLIAAASVLCARPGRGIMTVVSAENPGGFMARRLLPAAIIFPMMLGWVWLEGRRAGLFDPELGTALMVSANIAIFTILIAWNARVLNQADKALKLAVTNDLHQSEERLRYVLWATTDAVWDRDIEKADVWWNEGLQKLFHYGPDEVEPSVQWWEEHIHPDDRAKVIRSIQSIFETRQNLWSKEYRFQRADGSYANVFDRGYVLYDEKSGEPQRMLGALADISEQKNIEKALRQSEELFAKAFSATPVGITLTRMADGHLVEVNDAYLKLVGYDRREVLSHKALALGILQIDRTRLMRAFQDQGEVRDFEVRVQTKAGQMRTALCSLEPVEVGGVACILSVIYDITERKQAEAAQRQSEVLFRALFELSPDSVVVIDPYDPKVSWPIIDCNEVACQMNGYTREELIGKSIDILNGRVAPPEERHEFMGLLRENSSLKAEFQHRHKNGTFFSIEASMALIRLGDRELVIGIDRDITQRKLDEQALKEVNDRLERGLAELKERNHESVLLNELGNLLQSCPDTGSAYKIIGDSAAQLFPQARGTLSIINPANNQVEPAVTWNSRPDEERAFAPADCVALQERRAHFVDETYANSHCAHTEGAPAASICIPLIALGDVLGIFHLQYAQDESQPEPASTVLSQAEQRLAMTVADTVSLALTNLRLRESLKNQSIRDPLTGLYNRRYMEESLEREVHRALRAQKPVGIIMLDLDHFKNFNDQFGHEAGDTVLHELGHFIIGHIRTSSLSRDGDIACRYGGEEFLIIMPGASLEITQQRAQKLNDEIRIMQVRYRGQQLGGLTLSLGVAVFPQHGQMAGDVVRAADAALYRAKREGRDRVIVAGDV